MNTGTEYNIRQNFAFLFDTPKKRGVRKMSYGWYKSERPTITKDVQLLCTWAEYESLGKPQILTMESQLNFEKALFELRNPEPQNGVPPNGEPAKVLENPKPTLMEQVMPEVLAAETAQPELPLTGSKPPPKTPRKRAPRKVNTDK